MKGRGLDSEGDKLWEDGLEVRNSGNGGLCMNKNRFVGHFHKCNLLYKREIYILRLVR